MYQRLSPRGTIGRRTAFAAGAVVAALGLAACAGPSTAGAPAAEADEVIDWSTIEPATEITFWSNHPGMSQQVEEELIAQFTEETGIAVDLVTAGADYDEVAQKFQSTSQSPDALPDVVIASDVWWFRYQLNDQIMPLDDVLDAIDADAADFQQSLYSDYEFDDRHWAVPYARSTPLFYYNKDLWSAAGLPDRGPETWQELEEWNADLAAVLPEDGSTLGLSVGPSWGAWWFENMIWGHGGAYSDGFTPTLDTPEAIEAGDWLGGIFAEDGMATVSQDSQADFSAGIVASTIGSTGSLTGTLDAAAFEVGTAFLPDGEVEAGTPTGGTGLAIPSSRSPEQQLAAAMFLEFLTNTDNTAYFSQNTGYMPVRTSAVESDTMKQVYDEVPQMRTAVDQLAERARVQDDVRVFVPGADAILSGAIEEIVLSGTDAQTAFEKITPQLETAYAENVEPYL
ncbi:ABC transporter substrate-binding protein [Microbacterium betulae]|uniref:ABC transporter substrate-binding protein n=1 Tax=Microbacterium betulae TaxID=2981139 RepID=A0AA97FGG7_9MICO|nr:ABC transporter substrate-binding protein [Microbacterium sp. AB]WOF22540.1 ABC transporter substrate-binding protein [Microbacterium sp. AB]